MMNLKNQVLEILENNKGSYVSGGVMAKQLFVTRNAVWKAVQALKSEGYAIDAVTNKGYILSEKNSIVSPQSISKYIKEDLSVIVLDEVDSTNNYLKKSAENKAPEGTLVVAECQTNGKGRLGKSFLSPAGTGIYFSLLLRPECSAEKALHLTVMAAVAAARAIKEFVIGDVKIKWVNDVYVDGKKVCGILTEGSVSLENGGLDYAIIGTGINIFTPPGGFPDEIKDTAASLFPENEADAEIKSKIVGSVINRFLDMYRGNDKTFTDSYRSMSYLDGKDINIISGGKTEAAKALYIDEECRLNVKTENGEIIKLSSGDVSVRIK